MKTRFLAAFILMTTLALSDVFAQTSTPEAAKIEFENNSHDFGTVNEGGPITYEFKFTNKGTVPLTISNVRASCGCTTPSWTSEPVAPGQTGAITAQYNTTNRPGPFNKTLTVTANTEPAMTVITIKGNVLPKVKTPEELYPRKIGTIRMFSEHVYLGKVSTKEPIVKELTFYNEGEQPVTFSTHELPSYVEVTFQPATIGPKEKSTVKVTYNAAKRNELGPVEDKIVIKTTEANENKIVLDIVADINEYYPPLSGEEAANAPQAAVDKSIVDLGNVKPNVAVTTEVEIKNTGKQELMLKKIRSAAPYITVKPEKATVKAGHSIKIKITYKAPADKMGSDTQNIWIYSNDPSRPTQNFTIKALIGQ